MEQLQDLYDEFVYLTAAGMKVKYLNEVIEHLIQINFRLVGRSDLEKRKVEFNLVKVAVEEEIRDVFGLLEFVE
jgi:hypothetical protein